MDFEGLEDSAARVGIRIDITGMDRAEVLAALYKHARPGGASIAAMGLSLPKLRELTVDQARELLASAVPLDVRQPPPADQGVLYPDGKIHFDTLYACTLRVVFDGDTLDVSGYERDNGAFTARVAVAEVMADNGIDDERGVPTTITPA